MRWLVYFSLILISVKTHSFGWGTGTGRTYSYAYNDHVDIHLTDMYGSKYFTFIELNKNAKIKISGYDYSHINLPQKNRSLTYFIGQKSSDNIWQIYNFETNEFLYSAGNYDTVLNFWLGLELEKPILIEASLFFSFSQLDYKGEIDDGPGLFFLFLALFYYFPHALVILTITLALIATIKTIKRRTTSKKLNCDKSN